MPRSLMLALFAVIPLLGCGRGAAPATGKAAVEKPQPHLELAAYLKDDPKVHGFLCRPGGEGPYPTVVMIHDRLGLTDGIKDQTYRLARAGYVVLAVDLYRGKKAKSLKEAEQLEHELPRERALADVKAALDYLLERPDVRKMQAPMLSQEEEGREPTEQKRWDMGAIGLGMGGTIALEAALHDPRLRALVLCYCPLPTDAKRLTPLNASVFCLLAGKDRSVTTEIIKQFSDATVEAHKRVHPIRVYRDCQPGFLDPATWPADDQPSKEDIDDAWKLITEYLSEELK